MTTFRRTFTAVLLLALALVPWASAADVNLTVPVDMTVEAQSFVGAVVAFTATATDEDGEPVPVTCSPPSGSTFPLGTTTVTCTARAKGQTERKRFKVTVVDTTPPAISVPRQVTVRTRSRAGARVSWTPSALDLVDGPVSVSCTPAPTTRFPVGESHVTCSAADRQGNRHLATFAVQVVYTRAVKRSALLAPLAGARVTGPPLLQWRRARSASFYNVQVYRDGRKVLTAWPSNARFRMRRSWTYNGRRQLLKTGFYTWFVWPARGTLGSPRYGRLLGQSSFRVS